MEANTAALDRLTESVRQVGIGVTAVAGAVRAHPAAQDDSGKLNALADQLDQAATSLSGLAASVDAPADPTPAPEPTPEPAPAPAVEPVATGDQTTTQAPADTTTVDAAQTVDQAANTTPDTTVETPADGA